MDSMVTLTSRSRSSFVSPGEKYLCPVCGEVLNNALQTACGHRLCEPCLANLLSRQDPTPCPVSEESCELLSWNNQTVFRDVCACREVMGMLVFCSNRQNGCHEQVKLKDLQRHEEECAHARVECQNKALGCEAVLSRTDMQRHLAEECLYEPQKCGKCGDFIPAVQMMQHFKETCLEAEVTCSYGCGLAAKRKDMAKLEKSCPKKPIDCQFRVLGCTHACGQAQMADHVRERAADHLHMATRKLMHMDLEKAQLSSQVQSLSNENDLLNSRVKKINDEKTELEKQIASQTNKIVDLERKVVAQNDRLVVVEAALIDKSEQFKFEQTRGKRLDNASKTPGIKDAKEMQGNCKENAGHIQATDLQNVQNRCLEN